MAYFADINVSQGSVATSKHMRGAVGLLGEKLNWTELNLAGAGLK